jgi:hypothetical protein
VALIRKLPPELVTVTGSGIKDKVLVGVPEITPVDVLKLKPTEFKDVIVLAGKL